MIKEKKSSAGRDRYRALRADELQDMVAQARAGQPRVAHRDGHLVAAAGHADAVAAPEGRVAVAGRCEQPVDLGLYRAVHPLPIPAEPGPQHVAHYAAVHARVVMQPRGYALNELPEALVRLACVEPLRFWREV